MHYNDAIMSAMASQITNLMVVYATIYSRHRWKKTSKLHVTGLCEGNTPVTNGHCTGPVKQNMFLFDDVIMVIFPFMRVTLKCRWNILLSGIHFTKNLWTHNYTPRTTKLLGGYTGFTPSVRPSVCPSVRLSVRPSVRPACGVRSVSSTVMDGFFSY